MPESHVMERIVVRTSTVQVHGTHFRADEPRACVIIQGAAGVAQERYEALSRYLVDAGLSVLTYDYSGTGSSRVSSPGKEQRRPSLWGREDQAAMIGWAKARYGDRRLALVGHSLGGQIVGFSSSVADLDKVVLVAAQCPHVGNWTDPVDRLKVRAIWSVVFPGARRLFGYLPARVHGGAEHLSGPACFEGERWATHAWRRLLDEPGVRANMAAIRAPVRAYSFSDDRILAPREAVDAFAAGFTHAPVERLHITPRELGLDRIGHFGFFSRKATPLWRDLVAYLTESARTP
jgi:predicted alpha/beta hydrolase